MRLTVTGIGIVGPGLADWTGAHPVLAGDRPYVADTLRVTAPIGLNPNERRRATLATRLALDAARQATAGQPNGSDDDDRATLATIFASADGDMGLIDSMCRDIYGHRVPPSPTVFQNSVHNAVAGYWSIAEGCRGPSTSLAAGDGTFAAGLLEAATQVACFAGSVLLVAFEVPAPELLHPHRPFDNAFACAFRLAPASPDEDRTTLDLILSEDEQPFTPMQDTALEAMRRTNPAARALPLLAAIAAARPAVIRLPYWPGLQLEVRLEPCA
ncbi:MAG: beta-ketoacyl synthase chain length factor [Thiocapsa sp.]|uniref:beta-ketoacyl synthase chain length factor n=1 Tax=Thiocapsa sp. TaxID=2024551 RepID=UPI001BCC847C|nr:beta-ketoacyl synthase chain length factor [Thiocapsa sp.]QVL46796.1 MAG: beta-ketoacyl synthase chain length factor [Thiocapsa sp.]